MRVRWSVVKNAVDTKNLKLQYYEEHNAYWISVADGAHVLNCVIQLNNKNNDDRDDFVANYKDKSNLPIEPTTQEFGAKKVAIYKPEDSSSTQVSHDWTDRCTWYTDSILMEEALVLTLGYYQGTKPNWIDITHGRIYMEDELDRTYVVVIKDGETILVEDTNYTVDYSLGRITLIDYTVVDIITASYHYENGSSWKLIPTEGKKLILDHSEIQFSTDVLMNSPMRFEIWVYNPYFNPANAIVAWTPTSQFGVDNFLKFPYKVIRYKNIRDIINACNMGQGSIPAMSGLQHDVVVFPFQYVTFQSLKSSQGAELHLIIDGDEPMAGEWGTITFYVISDTE